MDIDNGENITPDDLYEIHRRAKTEVREVMNLNVNTTNKRGDIEDFLEIRRPYMQNNRQPI